MSRLNLSLSVIALAVLLAAPEDSWGQSSNRNEVRAAITADGWYVVWGVTINEAEYAKFTASVASAVVSENPGPVMAYFEDLAERNIDKMGEQVPSVGGAAVRDLVVEAFNDPERTVQRANLQVRAGIATYQRWNRIVYDEPRTTRCRQRLPFGGWTYVPCVRTVRTERTVSLPNHHQPYIKFRILSPGSVPPVAQPFTYWSYGAVQGGGYFQKFGEGWIEFKGGQQWSTFQELGATAEGVLLYDASRNMQVRLDRDQAYWRYPDGNWHYLFDRVH